MLLKPVLGIALGAAFGAAIGYSQLLCSDGGCAITGSWYGGAVFGGIMGMALTSALDSSLRGNHESTADAASPQSEDDTAQR